MREQHAQITGIIQGPAELFVAVFQDMRSTPVQHDFHCWGWRFEMFMQDAKLREAAMREEVRLIIKRRNDFIESRREQYAQAAE